MIRWLTALLLLSACKKPVTALPENTDPPWLAERTPHVDTLHGVEVADPYRWLEDSSTEAVQAWDEVQQARFEAHVDSLPQKAWLTERFQHLWRYDDESVPKPCLLSERIWVQTKRADQDKWVLHLRENEDDTEGRVILDPNTWEETETLAGWYPSPDCRYLAYGKAKAGDENPVIRVLDLDSLELLPDTLGGWKQRSVSWKHDNSGFFYTAWPKPGSVPEGEEFYSHSAWYHELGTTGVDAVHFDNPDVKEHFHVAEVSEDGRWVLTYRYQFSKNDMWIEDLSQPGSKKAVITGLEHATYGDVVDGKLVLVTDKDAPRKRLVVVDPSDPGVENWVELVPESEDTLETFAAIAGHLYVAYQHNAATRIRVYTLEGEFLKDVELPGLGSASVWGFWDRPAVWLSYSSYNVPSRVYHYDLEANALELYKKSPLEDKDLDVSNIVVDQVWYPSKDGTRISMFVIHNQDDDGPIPYLLYGYGGFDISMTPSFSTAWATWVNAGGGVAIANLRGGGEYGQDWHEAGMKEKKQNVFDDFIAAAEWLIGTGKTTADSLAIRGGSNGGLLVAAATVQRPDLFRAVLCEVPLTDMIRYHHYGLANIWSTEYGNSDDPEMFEVLRAYSPYHNVEKGTRYPAVIVSGSENDARTAPTHARKFGAALQWADDDHGVAQPILISIQKDSGHGGGVTIDTQVEQYARKLGFLMNEIGLQAPSEPVSDSK